MNIFLTGATGFVGTRLAQDLLSEGHTLYILIRNMKKATSFLSKFDQGLQNRIHFCQGDLSNETLSLNEGTINVLTNNIDAIYHIAALLSFDPSMSEETFKVNVDGTKAVIDFGLHIKCPRFLYVSTAYTVGLETKGEEILYNVDRAFVNDYERSKCHAEHLVASYKNQMEVMILRPSIIIGDSETGEADTSFGLYGILKAAAILKRKTLRQPEIQKDAYYLLLDRDVRSNLVPVDYVSKVLTKALTEGENGKIYNITNPNPLTQAEVVEVIKEVLHFPNLEIKAYGENVDLSPLEQVFNESLAVFKNYLSRELTFSCENTRKMLNEANEEVLHMGRAQFKKIVEGFVR